MSALHPDVHALLANLLGDVVAAGRGVVLLLRKNDILQPLDSHGLPASFTDQLRLPVDGMGGANGTAAHLGRTVVVQDTRVHPATIRYSNLLSAHRLFSMVSMPIFGVAGNVVATLALYGREPGIPSDDEMLALMQAAQEVRPLLS